MSKHSSAFNTIPSVLSIPEKLNAWVRKLLGLRFPVERHFSGRDLFLSAGAGLLLMLGVLIRALAGFRLYICILAALIAAVPLALQGWKMLRKKQAPLEEITWLLSALVAMLIGETSASPLILIFAGLLMQVEAYTLLHRDAAPDYLTESDLKLRHAVESADTEKSPERCVLASASLGFYALYVLIALVFAICTLFHPADYRIWLHRTLVFLVLASPSALLFSSLLTHFVPYQVTKLVVTCTYDVYDWDTSKNANGNLIRKDCTATNTIPLSLIDRFTEAERGKKYTLNLAVKPTYLYVMSDPDLNNPTMSVE